MSIQHAKRVVDCLQHTPNAMSDHLVAEGVLSMTSIGAKEIVLELMRRGLINPTQCTPMPKVEQLAGRLKDAMRRNPNLRNHDAASDWLFRRTDPETQQAVLKLLTEKDDPNAF